MTCKPAERAEAGLKAAEASEPQDLLADLMHLLGPGEFEEALSSAYMHYAYEVNDPDGLTDPCEHQKESTP